MSRPALLFVLASSRAGGNTEALAREAAAGLAGQAWQRWLRLSELPLAPFDDIRHTGDGVYPAPAGNEATLLRATLQATDLVIASPLYWYSVSASAKLYLDYWSAWLRVPGVEFKARMRGKRLWAICAHSSEDASAAEPLVGTLRRSADYLDMRFGGAFLWRGNRPGDVLADPSALAQARSFLAPVVGDARVAVPLRP